MESEMDDLTWFCVGLGVLVIAVLVWDFMTAPDDECDGRILPVRDDWGL